MPSSFGALLGSLFCLVVVCCCVLTSFVPNHLQDDLVYERKRFWGYTSHLLASSNYHTSTLRKDPFSGSTSLQSVEPNKQCVDSELSCIQWAASGECQVSAFMRKHCRKSCGLCFTVEAPNNASHVLLSSGHYMPRLGFGTAGLGDQTGQAVAWALEAGYGLIDSAQAREWYREDFTGTAVAESRVPRDRLFLTSKLHPRDLGQAGQKFQDSLRDLNTSYLDLFLLHYARCSTSLCGVGHLTGNWQSAWRELETLVKLGKVRSIGVSNFAEQELLELLEVADVKPSVVQSYSDIFHANIDLQRICRAHNIQFQAYSSLGTQWILRGQNNPILTAAQITGLAASHNTSAAHVALRWALQNGQAIIPRSSTKEHIFSNFKVLGSESLSGEEMGLLDALDSTLD